jgi:hypothetical protein
VNRVYLEWSDTTAYGVKWSSKIKFLGQTFMYQTTEQEGGGVALTLELPETRTIGPHGKPGISLKLGVYTSLQEAVKRAETHLGGDIVKLFESHQVVHS